MRSRLRRRPLTTLLGRTSPPIGHRRWYTLWGVYPNATLPRGVYRVNVPNRRGQVIVVSAWGKSAPTLLAASAATGLAETTIKAAATGSTEGLTDGEAASPATCSGCSLSRPRFPFL